MTNTKHPLKSFENELIKSKGKTMARRKRRRKITRSFGRKRRRRRVPPPLASALSTRFSQPRRKRRTRGQRKRVTRPRTKRYSGRMPLLSSLGRTRRQNPRRRRRRRGFGAKRTLRRRGVGPKDIKTRALSPSAPKDDDSSPLRTRFSSIIKHQRNRQTIFPS